MARTQETTAADTGKTNPWIDKDHYRKLDGTIGTRKDLTRKIMEFLLTADEDAKKAFFDVVEILANGTEATKEKARELIDNAARGISSRCNVEDCEVAS